MTVNKPPVCILTAGTGRRTAPLSDTINKCLLPYKGKAIISHTIEQFPISTSFVIAVGYKADQVRGYLNLMHPEYSFQFVEVDNYERPGSGPGHSLFCCKRILGNSFYFIAGDGIFENIPQNNNGNWLGIGKTGEADLTQYCNLEYTNKDAAVTQIYDKKQPPKDINTGVFSGLMFLKNADDFWHSLENTTYSGEKQVSHGFQALVKTRNINVKTVKWSDLGTLELYKKSFGEAYDFSKTNEFLYISESRVVKFFSEEKISVQRVKKAELVPDVFPRITGRKGQFFAYEKVPGNTMYEILDEKLFADFLIWLKERLWIKKKASAPQMRKICKSFYYNKTDQRLKLFYQKYPSFVEPKRVNNKTVLPIKDLLKKIPYDIYDGVPVFIHGDLHFDNTITNGKDFTLIDWRQDFAGQVELGDWYYDLAKLLGGIYLNYDYIKQGRMFYEEHGVNVHIKFDTRREALVYQSQLKNFIITEGLDFNRVEILRGLIYLNMAPLHHSPFDKLLYALAQTTLSDVLTC
tara:strand:- start:149 stop:1708 length:1560 start_codon:yes stop_codon:yes gene_type:complete